jgi:hypothetical protein
MDEDQSSVPIEPAIDATSTDELQKLIGQLEHDLGKAMVLLQQVSGGAVRPKRSANHVEAAREGGVTAADDGSVIIEGVFDGQHMVGPDGKLYSVPANYASKSKLVEGDMLKLTIQPDGSFVYKQINPATRQRLVGVLAKDPATGNWQALAGGHVYSLLTASVSYFKGRPGDAVVVLVPKDSQATWGAVENIIHEDSLHQAE